MNKKTIIKKNVNPFDVIEVMRSINLWADNASDGFKLTTDLSWVGVITPPNLKIEIKIEMGNEEEEMKQLNNIEKILTGESGKEINKMLFG